MPVDHGNLGPLDWTIIFGYLAGLIGLSAWLARGQSDRKDYYLGGNSTGPLPIALSTMATQCSTNSLLGAPAFVAFAVGGGLVWLQYELAVPFAMIGLMLFMMPVLRAMKLISVYQFVEERFNLPARLLLSALFLLLRAFATGVTIFGVGLTIAKVLDVSYVWAVLILMTATIIYDFLGGMKAVIWSDVIQMIIIFGAIIASAVVAVNLNGGFGDTLAAFPPARLEAIDFQGTGLGDGKDYAFWPMLIGGFFLYLAYYGCDQTQVQRSLATRNVDETNQALFIGGLLRFPLVLSYCLLGVAIGAYAALYPEFVDSLTLHGGGKPDWNLAVPVFVLDNFPTGMIGLVLVGILGAAMSSLDSTLNSMSAVTMQDFIHRLRQTEISERGELWLSKFTTVFWGLLCLAFSFYVGDIAPTVIEAVNKISSVLNGPLLALFTMGLLTRFIGPVAVMAGLVIGLLANAALWLWAPSVSWLWWNVSGFLVAWAVALVVVIFEKHRPAPRVAVEQARFSPTHVTWRRVAILAGYGLLLGVGLTFI